MLFLKKNFVTILTPRIKDMNIPQDRFSLVNNDVKITVDIEYNK